MSDAVSSLEEKGLIRRDPWPQDRRVVSLRLTPVGEELAAKLSTWANTVQEHLGFSSPTEKEVVMRFLIRLIASLQRSGIIGVSRMCVTCQFFRPDEHPGSDSPHHCGLLGAPLAASDLRVDCPEHELAAR